MKSMMNKTEARNAPIDSLIERGWELLTSRGYSSKGARPILQRRLRAAGVRYFIGHYTEDRENYEWSQWGMLTSGEQPPSIGGIRIETGVSLNHAAHKFGDGCAKRGTQRYMAL